ncbi:MAG: hypothetical protein AABM40_08345 [Chloroflexota bacterium]
MGDRKLASAQFFTTWFPLAAVLVGITMVLVDFNFNYVHQWYLADVGWVRYFTYDQLYDLTLHLSMLAVGFAGALTFAAVARSAFRGSVRAATTS